MVKIVGDADSDMTGFVDENVTKRSVGVTRNACYSITYTRRVRKVKTQRS